MRVADGINAARAAGLALSAAVLALLVCAVPALALAPIWKVNTVIAPTNLPPGGSGRIIIYVSNLGDATAQGAVTPIEIADRLPAGLTATSIQGSVENGTAGGSVVCTLASVSCEYANTVLPYGLIEVTIGVSVAANASAHPTNEVDVSGGGAIGVSTRRALNVSSAPTGFGVENLELTVNNEDGSPDTQAGSHPFQLTTTFNLDAGASSKGGWDPVGLAKDLRFSLPAGLVGNPTVLAQCNMEQFSRRVEISNQCPDDTVVGVASTDVGAGTEQVPSPFIVPIFNLTPAAGEPARFGYEIFGVPVILDTSVRTGGDYGVVVSVNNIQQSVEFESSQVTFWGVPGDPRHNASRGWNCLLGGYFGHGSCQAPQNAPQTPFLTLPTSCAGLAGMRTTVQADSWAAPGTFLSGEYAPLDNGGEPLGLDGCNRLPFSPSISVAPDGSVGSTPTGLTVGVHVPQGASLNPAGLTEADVNDTTVTLPEGLQLSPAGADGLLSCSLEQVSLETPSSPTCPEAAKVGTVEIKTPLLPNPLEGAAYLAAQNANPFGSLIALYIVAEDPTAGVVVKFAGKVVPDPVTGQLVSTFESTPQLPFEDLKLHFFGSARAPLTTPPLCGSYTTTASFVPWSGNAPAQPSSTFQITSGPNGGPCADPRPFQPGFQAGSTNLQAGAFTPFTLTMSRPDADQTLAGLSIQMPPGLAGSLSKVQLCPEPQASQGACPAGSLIGHTVVSAGLGNAPFTVEGGQVFITGPYKGAPFGLSILNPAKAGPFDLGYVVVRAKIEVDPTTAALHIVSDPLPTILDGIPLQIQHVNVTVDRPQFTFNPTNCSPMSLTGAMSSTEGASSSVSTPFQVTNCATLAFKPGFSVSTSGRPSRANGESLDVKLTYPSAPQGAEANISRVKVELPKQLPSRLTTLQKACTEATFDTNPEACPAASRIGEAFASTPILVGGLSGPAYFVSHGGAKFPELIVVLKGENGVTVDLHGETFISKKGITSSTFASVPDVPVGSFELKLPMGPYSALAANGNLCKSKLTMPTEFHAQNGAIIHQDTKIHVTSCPKATKASGRNTKRKHAKRGRRARGRRRRR
jgi:hypothetical protein